MSERFDGLVQKTDKSGKVTGAVLEGMLEQHKIEHLPGTNHFLSRVTLLDTGAWRPGTVFARGGRHKVQQHCLNDLHPTVLS